MAVGAGIVAATIILATSFAIRGEKDGASQKKYGYEKNISVSFCNENGSCVEVLNDFYRGIVRKGTLEQVIFGMRKADRNAICKMLAAKNGGFHNYDVIVEQDMEVRELASETPKGVEPKLVGNVERQDSYGAREFCSRSGREMDFEFGLPKAPIGKKTLL